MQKAIANGLTRCLVNKSAKTMLSPHKTQTAINAAPVHEPLICFAAKIKGMLYAAIVNRL